MSSIVREGDTYHGISVFGRGVFTNDENGWTYAGQHRDGYACGLGVLTMSDWDKEYAEYGPDGQYDGRNLVRYAGDTGFRLCERGEGKDEAFVSGDGDFYYNDEYCEQDDPRFLALTAQVAPVEVRPAAPAPIPPIDPHSPPSNHLMDRPARFATAGAGGRRGHRGAPPRRTPSLVVARHSPTAATLPSTSTPRRVHGLFAVLVTREAPSCTH